MKSADLFALTELRLQGNYTLELSQTGHAEEVSKIIERERLYLREWLPWVDSSKDLRSCLDYFTRCVHQHRMRQSVQFTICYEGLPIGAIGTHDINWPHRSTSIGYWLSEKYTGKGVMTAAVKLLTDILFNEGELNRLELRTAVGNLRSQRVALKAGFTPEGVLREAEFLNGRYVDLIVHSQLRREWLAHQ